MPCGFAVWQLILSNSWITRQVNKRCRFLLDFEQKVKHALVGLTPDKHPFGGQEVDASSLGWAMSAVSSRAFKLHGNKQSNGINFDIPMMLPLIDMCNHSFNPNARIVQEQEAGSTKMWVKACYFILFPSWLFSQTHTLTRQILLFRNNYSLNFSLLRNSIFAIGCGWESNKEDDPLLLCYGCLSNDLFLLDYG